MHRRRRKAERERTGVDALSIKARATSVDKEIWDVCQRSALLRAKQSLAQGEQGREIVVRQVRVDDIDLAIGLVATDGLDQAVHHIDRRPAVRRAEIGDDE